MVAPSAAGVGDAVIGSVFGVSEQTRAEFPVKATWSISAPGYFKSGHTDTHSVSFSSDDPESVQVTAVNKGPPGRQGSASAQFVKVLSIEADPVIVCVGNSNIAYTITTLPTGLEYMVSYTPADTSTPGVKEVIATCGSSSATCTVTVVGVDHLEYRKESEQDWAEMPEPLCVGLGQKIYFRAVKQPVEAPRPDGKPVWEGIDESSTDTAVKTFNEVSATADDFKLVKAECGNTVTGLVWVISNYTILPSSRFICLSNTVTAEAWTVDESGAAVKTNSDWTIPEGAGRVAFVYGARHTNTMTNASVVTIIGINVSAALDDVQVHAHATGDESLADDERFTVIKVEFNKDPVKIGIGANRISETPVYPATTPATYPHRLMATITPKDGAGTVTFDSSNAARMTVAEVSRIDVENTKQVVLQVTGVAKTPAALPGGDADVRALLNGSPCKTTKAIVLVPAAIHSPHPEFDGTVAGQNLALDSTTSPSANVGAGNILLASMYMTFLTITVDDQFGNTLHAIYAGAPVTEYGGTAINQVMTASGTYSDPVGMGTSSGVVPAENPPGTQNPAIAAFLASPVPLAPNATGVQNVPVEVDGHLLNPTVVNRTVTTSPPNNLKIKWPKRHGGVH